MTIMGITNCPILAILRSSSILRNAIDKHPTSIMPFGLPGPATLAVSLVAQRLCLRLYLPPGLPGHPPEACCCGAARVVSGPFGRSSQGTASEVCRLWGTRRGGSSCCRCSRVRVCPCKQLTHRYEVRLATPSYHSLTAPATCGLD